MEKRMASYKKSIAASNNAKRTARLKKFLENAEISYKNYSKQLATLEQEQTLIMKRFDHEKAVYLSTIEDSKEN